jgi:mono/diheme cytochrome c family protein
VRQRRILLGCVAALVAGSVFWIVRAAGPDNRASAADPRDVKAGQALYAQYCASCHGAAGRGDGPAAAGFATKPSDLADGRLMNALPDEFLASVILRGGPAEGLAPGMPPFSGYLSDAQTTQVLAYLRSIASPPFRPEMAKPLVTVPNAPRQPIFFSHVIHAGSFQIACQHCHADARRSHSAGLPSVERCMGCHKIIGAQDNPEIAKIHEYARRVLPPQASRALRDRLSDLPRPDRADARRRRRYRAASGRRPPEVDRPSSRSARAHDGVVHRLPS